MFLRKAHSKAQSISEYVLVIGIVSIALISMQAYMKRGVQAVIKVASDQAGNQSAEEIDVQKGTKTDSQITTLNQDSERLQSFVGGSQTTTVAHTSTSSGETTNISIERE